MQTGAKTRRFVALGLVLAAAACGRGRQPNVPPGEERVFRKTLQADVGRVATTRAREDEAVSEDELGRRNLVRQIEAQFVNAKSSVDRLDALGNLDNVLQSLQGRAPELVPHVARCLTDPDPDQRMYGIRARVAIWPKDALPDVKLVLRDADPKVRQAAVEAFGMLPEPLPFDDLFGHLGSEREPLVQQAVLLLIANRGGPSELGRALDVLESVDVRAVGPIVEMARKFPAIARGKADRLAYFLDRNDADLRLQVAKLLGEWGVRSPLVISGLVRTLNDDQTAVRKAALNALKSLSGKDFGFDPEADAKGREEAFHRWRAWAREGAGETPASAPAK